MDILKTQTRVIFGLATLVVSGCAQTPAQISDTQQCEIGGDLLQHCEPPVLPTVHTMEQFDLAFTEAYVCTNQLNAQLAEILRRCAGEDTPPSEEATLVGPIRINGSDIPAPN